MATSTNPITQNLLDQLGKMFVPMVGAKNLVALENGLQFSLPRNKTKATICRITLNGNDLYDVEFGSVRNFEYKIKVSQTDLYVEEMIKYFERETGFYTTLSPRRA